MPDNTPVQLRQIGVELRRFRLAAHRTASQAGAQLNCSHSKISKIENGAIRIKSDELRKLLDYYEVPEVAAEHLVKLNDQPRQRAWWEPYRDAVPDWFRRYVSLEAACSEVLEYQAEAIPGLLQVEDYARSVLRAWEPEMGEHVLRNPVELRMARQQLLNRDDPAQYTAVISESCLRRQVGDEYTMARQLKHLLRVAELHNVDIRVLPFSAPPHPIVASGFTLLGFPDNDDAIVYLEDVIGATYPDSPSEVGRYTLIFNRLRAAALGPEESKEMIATVAAGFP